MTACATRLAHSSHSFVMLSGCFKSKSACATQSDPTAFFFSVFFFFFMSRVVPGNAALLAEKKSSGWPCFGMLDLKRGTQTRGLPPPSSVTTHNSHCQSHCSRFLCIDMKMSAGQSCVLGLFP